MRPPSDALRRAISSHPDRDRIDPERARAEHAAYVRTLEASGLAVTLLPPEADMPDACFTWDTILAFPQPGDASAVLLVAARPGAPSRRPEVESVLACARRLAPGAEVVEIDDPGTLDGGDVITYGTRVAIGVSARTNEAGARQLASAVGRIGYHAFLCPVEGRLHLASAITPLRARRLIGTQSGFQSLDAGGPDAAPDAAEGLTTIVIEPAAIGGQAGNADVIRNYPGFPDGVSGDELARRLANQATMFNVGFISNRAAALTPRGTGYSVGLADRAEIIARSVVVATGAAIRRLGIQNVDRLAGKGVAYGTTVSEPAAMTGEDVVVVGADPSTGPAALGLARYARNVTIVVRGAIDVALSPDMAKQIERTRNIRVRVNSQVVDAYGESRLEGVIVRHRVSGTTEAG